MRGIVTVEAVLIFVILVGVTAMALPYVYSSLQQTSETSEVQSIRQQFDVCSDRIVETARTGSSNRCSFSASKGAVSAKEDGLHYTIDTDANICSQSEWVEVDNAKHLWSKCDVSGNHKVYQLLWSWPKNVTIIGGLFGSIYKGDTKQSDIEFTNPVKFRVLSLFVEFKTEANKAGRFMDIKREEITSDKVVLSISFS